ncbi:hypothetical protein AWC38_SpisGene24283 [Stylophora pistillata]|uniref:Uncharacterized protein n=1 Tax=Stylophora pistillata TaxID=50429 RepID=A0A2B4R4W6_STYPI|nr:hypothetical protein AWC38_SpisGene24283 [Stylophora pistillata]
MRWKAHFFLNPDTTPCSKETYGFKSTKKPPPIEDLKDFEDEMLKMILSVKFKQGNNSFLNKLKEDTDSIKTELPPLIAADKTMNFYKLESSKYNDLIEKNITKSYKKAQPETIQAIHKQNKDIATKVGIDDRVDTIANKDEFTTLKYHKPTFTNKPTSRLINPTSSEIGKVSKGILDRINSDIAKTSSFNQWKNTASTLMSVLRIPITAARAAPLVQTLRDHSTALAILDSLEMDTPAKKFASLSDLAKQISSIANEEVESFQNNQLSVQSTPASTFRL